MGPMTMNSLKKTLFISDLHLDESDPVSFEHFKKLINELDENVDALYILGDFFEVWVGDDNQSPFYDSIIALLKAANEKRIPVYILHGNRDFLLGQSFFQQAKCTFLPDESRITIYKTPVLLMHGDTLCTADHAYQRARKLMRNRFLQYVFLHLPLSFRKKIANELRNASKRHTTTASMNSMDVTQQEVERVMQNHRVSHLIHGHTHRPNIHQFTLDGESCSRMVLGAWHSKPSVLTWYEDGRKELS